MNAGPANATAPIPANTLPSPIAFKPSANDFNPPSLPCACGATSSAPGTSAWISPPPPLPPIPGMRLPNPVPLPCILFIIII